MSNNFTFLQMQILKVSPKGQVTIPKKYRDLCRTGNFAIEVTGKTIVLKPIEIRPIDDDTENFVALGLSSFDFWNDPADDIYEEFYKNKSV